MTQSMLGLEIRQLHCHRLQRQMIHLLLKCQPLFLECLQRQCLRRLQSQGLQHLKLRLKQHLKHRLKQHLVLDPALTEMVFDDS